MRGNNEQIFRKEKDNSRRNEKINGEKEIIYSCYRLSLTEYLKYGTWGLMIEMVFSYIFYESIIVFFAMIPALIPYFHFIKKKLYKKRQEVLKREFKELCMSLAAQMSAGYSMENSIKESYAEMKELYGENSYICRELNIMIEKLRYNIKLEEMMLQLAIRSENEDIRLFSEVLSIAKQSGGDMIQIVKSAALNISEKTDVEREIKSILSEKKFEQMIMNIIPLAMILYIKVSSPEMMAVMYRTIAGKIIMSVCFAIYIFSFLLGKRIMDIEV